MIDELLDKALEDVDSNPYKAYKKYVDLFYYDMTGKVHIPVAALIFVAAACTAVYVGVNLGRNKGQKTTGVATYVSVSYTHLDVYKRQDSSQ